MRSESPWLILNNQAQEILHCMHPVTLRGKSIRRNRQPGV